MDKTAAFVLVVVVLLAGAAGPGLALQGGPPDHANDDGNGPPDHANAGGDDGADDDADDAESGDDATAAGTDDDDDGPPGDRDTDEEGGDGEATDHQDGADDDDAGVLTVVDEDDGAATQTPTDRATSTESDESGTPTNPVEPVLDILETPEETPEDPPESTTEETSAETDESSSQEQDPLPTPPERTETPTPTPEPTETPEEEDEETPESTPRPTGGSDDGDRDEGSGSTASSDSEPTETPSEPSIEYDNGEDVTRANVEDVRAGQTVEVPLRGPATDGEGVAVESVAVGVESGEPFTLTVTRPTADGAEDPAPGVPVGYFDAETDHDAVGDATLTVAVDEAALPAGVAPEDLEVMRYADGEWESTETTYDEEAGVYTAETDGFSKFAIAAPGDGPLQVTDVEVDDDGSGDGDAATVHATVENTVDRQATGTVAITVDGETLETREVTLGGGETATVAFDLPAERAEGETVAVDGVEAERFQVEETDRETAVGSIDGNLAFGIGAAAFLVISAVGTGLLAARRDEWDWER